MVDLPRQTLLAILTHYQKFDDKDKLDPKRKATLELLRQLNDDGSPARLATLNSTLSDEAREGAFAPAPKTLPVSDILFDSWSLTTIRDKLPGRPPVEPYLHGLSDWQPPETQVAWREEVGIIKGDLLQKYDPEDLLEDYPLKPHELLKDSTERVYKRLGEIAEQHPDPEKSPAWLVDGDGTVLVSTLKALADGKKDQLNYRVVLLPPEVGGLKKGMLDGKSSEKVEDVCDNWFADAAQKVQRRRRIRNDDPMPKRIDNMRLVRDIDTKANEEEDGSSASSEVEEPSEEERPNDKGRYWWWYVRLRSADDDGSKTSTDPVTWDDHTNQVRDGAAAIVKALKLPPEWPNAFILAARWHDLGKKRVVWQRSIGNPNPTYWYAKSGKDWKPVEITRYRHEFGSLVDVYVAMQAACRGTAMAPHEFGSLLNLLDIKQEHFEEFQKLDDDMRELVLHAIAAHHGRARPHFPGEEVFDPVRNLTDADGIAEEVPRRFARLQRKYGRWGLAYLESLLRAADIAASINPKVDGKS